MSPNPLKTDSPFLLFGALLAFASTFGQTYFIGALQPFISAEYGWNAAEFGRIYLAVTLASFFGINALGHVLDRMSLRRYILLISGAMLLALLCLTVATPVFLLIPALMAVRLIGQGLMVHAAFTSMGRYFDQWRGRAIAIANAGIPIGQATLPPLALFMLQTMSWRETLFWLAITVALALIPLLQILLIGHEKRHQRWLTAAADSPETTPQTADSKTKTPAQLQQFKRHDVIRDSRFYMLVPTILLAPFWVTAVFFFADQVAAMQGLSLLDLSANYVYFGLGGALIPFIGGWLVDRSAGRKLIALPALMMLAAFALLLANAGNASLIGYFILLGSGSGFAIPINNALWAELYGTRFLGEIKSLITAIAVLSTAVAPMLVGELLVAGVDIADMIWAAIAHVAIAIPLSLYALRQRPINGHL